MDFQIGMIDVALLVLAVTQGVKALTGAQGKTSLVVAFVAGFVLVALSHGLAEGLIPVDWAPYIEWAVTSIAGALTAIGVYEFGKSGVGLYRAANQR